MTLKEAHDCLERKPAIGCKGCVYEHSDQDCSAMALEIGVSAIDYMMVGEKLRVNLEGK